MKDIASYIGTGIFIAYSSTYSSYYNNFNLSSMFIAKENFEYSMPSKIIEHNFQNIIVKENKSYNNYENDAIEIPVVKKMRFKFNKPTKIEFV